MSGLRRRAFYPGEYHLAKAPTEQQKGLPQIQANNLVCFQERVPWLRVSSTELTDTKAERAPAQEPSLHQTTPKLKLDTAAKSTLQSTCPSHGLRIISPLVM